MPTPTSAFPPIPADVVKVTGPMFLAYLLNWGLFGVLAMQTYQYYIQYPEDRWLIKALAYTICTLETIQTSLFTASGFNTFGYGYGNMMAVDELGVGWLAIPITGGLVAFLAHSFYAYRISVLAKSHLITPFILLLSSTQLVTLLILAVRIRQINTWSEFMDPTTYIMGGVWESASALCDVLITTCMIYHLRKRDAIFQRTRIIITRLIHLAIGTGAVTALAATATLVMTFIKTDTAVYQVTGANLGKLYSLSVLVGLNERKPGRSSTASITISQDIKIASPDDSRDHTEVVSGATLTWPDLEAGRPEHRTEQ